jgi:4-amino-4-deoxy-L-arabinose transferase-like glycosyltransferase
VSRTWEWATITVILLLAGVLRLWGLGDVPPGLAHDEVANWLIARDILGGHHAIYFTAAYGHEPFYQYAQALAVALFGDNWLGLRWPSAAFGLLSIAAIYILVRRLFDVPVALLTAAWLAVSFWPLFYARVAVRAITLPFTAALAAYFLLRTGVQSARGSVPWAVGRVGDPPVRRTATPEIANWLLAGLLLGLSLYTYMASRILPAIIISFLVYSFLVRSPSPFPWFSVAAFLLIATLVSAPLVVWLMTHPGAEYRVTEIQEPLNRMLDGDLSLVWQNLIANLKFFTLAGDSWPRQNIPGRPVFADLVSAALFYLGLLISLWRWRDRRHGLLLIWLIGSLAPSVATSIAPSSIRDILGLVVVFVFPALALVEAGRLLLSAFRSLLSASRFLASAPCFLPFVSCCVLLVPCLLLTVRDYFVRWPQNEVVRFDYQTDLTAVAHRLDELPPGTPVTVAGLSVHSMDGPGLELAARRDVQSTRLCDTRETLVIPSGHSPWLFVPQVVPFDADLQERLLGWGAVMAVDPLRSFTSYHLPDDADLRHYLGHLETWAALPGGTSVSLPLSFGGQMTLLGYERLQQPAVRGGVLTLLTYWRVERPVSAPLKAFVHLLGQSDTPVAQHDRLGSPPRGWTARDLIVQKHTMSIPIDLPDGQYAVQVGLYDSTTGDRLPVLTADRLLLYSLEVSQ